MCIVPVFKSMYYLHTFRICITLFHSFHGVNCGKNLQNHSNSMMKDYHSINCNTPVKPVFDVSYFGATHTSRHSENSVPECTDVIYFILCVCVCQFASEEDSARIESSGLLLDSTTPLARHFWISSFQQSYFLYYFILVRIRMIIKIFSMTNKTRFSFLHLDLMSP